MISGESHQDKSEKLHDYVIPEGLTLTSPEARTNDRTLLERRKVLLEKAQDIENPIPVFAEFTDPESEKVAVMSEALSNNEVLYLEASTGAGKSVFGMIGIEAALRKADYWGEGKKYMVQPRRDAAHQVGGSLAALSGEKTGEKIGVVTSDMSAWAKHTEGLNVLTSGVAIHVTTEEYQIIRNLTAEDADNIRDAVSAGSANNKLLQIFEPSLFVVDEVHENSVDYHLILGSLKLINKKRVEIGLEPHSIVLMSATPDPKVGEFFDIKEKCHQNYEGRAFPVDIEYFDEEQFSADHTNVDRIEFKAAWQALQDIRKHSDGDTLIFMPGAGEIRKTKQHLENLLQSDAYQDLEIEICELYGQGSYEERTRIIEGAKADPNKIRIVIATNIAETSLTVPGVTTVIDAGLERKRVFNEETGVEEQVTRQTSQANSIQRAGRAGRVQAGRSYRLFSEEKFYFSRKYPTPEIHESNLSRVLLQISNMGIRYTDFEFPDPPEQSRLDHAAEELRAVGALDGDGNITELGKKMSRIPLEPRMAAIIVNAESLPGITTKETAILTFFANSGDYLGKITDTSVKHGSDVFRLIRGVVALQKNSAELESKKNELARSKKGDLQELSPSKLGQHIESLENQERITSANEIRSILSGEKPIFEQEFAVPELEEEIHSLGEYRSELLEHQLESLKHQLGVLEKQKQTLLNQYGLSEKHSRIFRELDKFLRNLKLPNSNYFEDLGALTTNKEVVRSFETLLLKSYPDSLFLRSGGKYIPNYKNVTDRSHPNVNPNPTSCAITEEPSQFINLGPIATGRGSGRGADGGMRTYASTNHTLENIDLLPELFPELFVEIPTSNKYTINPKSGLAQARIQIVPAEDRYSAVGEYNKGFPEGSGHYKEFASAMFREMSTLDWQGEPPVTRESLEAVEDEVRPYANKLGLRIVSESKYIEICTELEIDSMQKAIANKDQLTLTFENFIYPDRLISAASYPDTVTALGKEIPVRYTSASSIEIDLSELSPVELKRLKAESLTFDPSIRSNVEKRSVMYKINGTSSSSYESVRDSYFERRRDEVWKAFEVTFREEGNYTALPDTVPELPDPHVYYTEETGTAYTAYPYYAFGGRHDKCRLQYDQSEATAERYQSDFVSKLESIQAEKETRSELFRLHELFEKDFAQNHVDLPVKFVRFGDAGDLNRHFEKCHSYNQETIDRLSNHYLQDHTKAFVAYTEYYNEARRRAEFYEPIASQIETLREGDGPFKADTEEFFVKLLREPTYDYRQAWTDITSREQQYSESPIEEFYATVAAEYDALCNLMTADDKTDLFYLNPDLYHGLEGAFYPEDADETAEVSQDTLLSYSRKIALYSKVLSKEVTQNFINLSIDDYESNTRRQERFDGSEGPFLGYGAIKSEDYSYTLSLDSGAAVPNVYYVDKGVTYVTFGSKESRRLFAVEVDNYGNTTDVIQEVISLTRQPVEAATTEAVAKEVRALEIKHARPVVEQVAAPVVATTVEQQQKEIFSKFASIEEVATQLENIDIAKKLIKELRGKKPLKRETRQEKALGKFYDRSASVLQELQTKHDAIQGLLSKDSQVPGLVDYRIDGHLATAKDVTAAWLKRLDDDLLFTLIRGKLSEGSQEYLQDPEVQLTTKDVTAEIRNLIGQLLTPNGNTLKLGQGTEEALVDQLAVHIIENAI